MTFGFWCDLGLVKTLELLMWKFATLWIRIKGLRSAALSPGLIDDRLAWWLNVDRWWLAAEFHKYCDV